MAKQSVFTVFWNQLPLPIRNKYILTGIVFVVWLLFFDRNNVISQIRLRSTLSEIKSKVGYLKAETAENTRILDAVFKNDATLRQMARDKYMMKAPNEDVYYIPDEEK